VQRIDIDTDRLRTAAWNVDAASRCNVQGIAGPAVVLEGVGHGPLLERSERVAELIAEVSRARA
jgi:pimeloyl-ACP methyl ester carboxylesterase